MVGFWEGNHWEEESHQEEGLPEQNWEEGELQENQEEGGHRRHHITIRKATHPDCAHSC